MANGYGSSGYGYGKKPDYDAGLSALKEKIKAGGDRICGFYVFHGEEEYMKRSYFSSLCKSAGAGEENVTVIDRRDFSFEKLNDTVNAAPAIDYTDSFFDDGPAQTKKTVRVIKCVSPKLSAISEKEVSLYTELFEFAAKTCVLVFYYPYFGDDDKDEKELIKPKSTVLKLISGALDVYFRHELPQSALLKKWIRRHFDAEKVIIGDLSVMHLIDSVGCDMATLSFEISKLCAYAKTRENRAIYDADIDFICIKTTDARIDDITKSIFAKNYVKAVSALGYLVGIEKNKEIYYFGCIANKIAELSTVDYYKNCGYSASDIVKVTGMRDYTVKNHMRTLSDMSGTRRDSSFCDDYAHILCEYDEKLKNSAANKYLLLCNMVAKLCAV